MNKRERNPITFLFATAWKYSEGNRRNMILFLAMFAIANVIALMVEPFIYASIFKKIEAEGVTEANYYFFVGLLVLAIVGDAVFWGFHGPARLLERTNAFLARVAYRASLLRGVFTLPLEWHAEHHSGQTIDKTSKGTSALYEMSANMFQIVYSATQFAGSYAVLMYFSPRSAPIVIVMTAVTAWIIIRFDRAIVRNYRELNRAENRIAESISDAISNITTVIVLRVEKYLFNAILARTKDPLPLYIETSKLNEYKWFCVNMCCKVTQALVLSVYFYEHIHTKTAVLIGTVYLLVQYLNRVSDQFDSFANTYSQIIQWRSKVANSEELSEDFKPERLENHVLPREWNTLAIKDLCFSYPENDSGELHLENVNLSFQKGERLAFVGESGSGKSTLLKVMRDLYHPHKLGLFVDGVRVPQGFEGISRAITLVPQDPEIFATTVIENITLGAAYRSELVAESTDMACFTDVAKKLPKGFESSIKEKGVNLSGGQQQRLALARGLLAAHDKDIVLLDEPTSSLDSATEMRVYQNIFRTFREKTVISTIHRLHLLPLFDRICVFDRGQLVATGTLDDLLATSPTFEALWRTYVEQKEVA